MAPVSDVEREGDGSRSLLREDCLCPICLEIFMEPVTLPCTHTFCKVCFLESVDKATLCCPLCRKRVAVWVRQHSRSKTLVNEALWARVQNAFPRQRLQEESYEPVFCPRLSEPGALRQEYEEQISKLTEERRETDEQERIASEELIQRLLAEEEQLLREQRQRHEEDERLAHLLNQELNSVPDLEPASEQSSVKKKPTGIDRFLFPVSRSPAHSTVSNKENVLATPDPPPLDYYGPRGQSQPQEPRAEDQSQLRPAEGGAKRKSASEEGAESQGKRSCQSPCPLGVAADEWEELERRRKQEEDDLRLALQLQQQLDKQQRQTDRRKGSEDAYHLRTARPVATATSATAPPSSTATTTAPPTCRRPPSSTATSAGPSPASARLKTGKGEKGDAARPKAPPTSALTPNAKRQTTLTDLFNLHS